MHSGLRKRPLCIGQKVVPWYNRIRAGFVSHYAMKEGQTLFALIFFLLWIIFNGRVTVEVALFGAIISAALGLFTRKYVMTAAQAKQVRALLRKVRGVIRYLILLIKEIAQANKAVLALILSGRHEVQPKLTQFRTRLRTRAARVVLADSITLTPGTITVSLEGDLFVVHCLDEDFESGVLESSFEKCLMDIEQTGSAKETA